MGDKPNPSTDVNVGIQKASDKDRELFKEAGGPFDTNLITSEVCLQCAACCKTTTKVTKTSQKYAEEYIEYGIAMWGYSKDKFKIEGEGSRWVILVHHTCVQLNSDNTCKLYERRPKICKKFNCLWSSNIDKRLPQSWPIVKKLIDVSSTN